MQGDSPVLPSQPEQHKHGVCGAGQLPCAPPCPAHPHSPLEGPAGSCPAAAGEGEGTEPLAYTVRPSHRSSPPQSIALESDEASEARAAVDSWLRATQGGSHAAAAAALWHLTVQDLYAHLPAAPVEEVGRRVHGGVDASYHQSTILSIFPR